MKTEYVISGILVIALGAGAYLLLGTSPHSPPSSTHEICMSVAQKEARYEKAPELVTPDGYINTPRLPSGQAGPITIGEFKGKNPVLIDIWTYSCINCQRTLPYLRSWYEKYKDDGLVIIGVHTPEFAFEKVRANVENAAREFGLEYPIVLDNEYKTWNAFGNRFWPRKYLIDIDGYIVYDHAGEGAYEETERAIQKVLAERAERLDMEMPLETISSPSDVTAVDFSQVKSPEVYFGSDRNELLGNGEIGISGVQRLEIPKKLFANTLYLGGSWDMQPEYARNTGEGAAIRFIYSAKNVYVVASSDTPVRVNVTRDGGKPLGDDSGVDVDEGGFVTIQKERLYSLIEGAAYETHLLEITVEGEGIKAYTFTFG